jgi:exosortase
MHGWAVPFLVISLLRDRRLKADPTPAQPVISRGAIVLLTVAVIEKISGELVIEANPYWPKLLWLTNGFAVFLFSGGRTAKQCLVPLLFTFSALPWPALILSPLTLNLATFNAHAAAGVLSATGFPAAVNGRVIELSNGVVGIDEACSGIRSLQTVTMVAFFWASCSVLGLIEQRVYWLVPGLLRCWGTSVEPSTSRGLWFTPT